MFYVGSSVLESLSELEAQRALTDCREICARECFTFLTLVTLS
jgi:hypothetical protein